MRPLPSLLAFVSVLLLSACATPDSRIASNRAAFEKLPGEIQQKIRAGQVDVGFTREMVLFSLGEPDRKFIRKTEAGDTEVWGYRDSTPRFSIGLGIGGGGRHTAVEGGLEMSAGGIDPAERIRIEFRAGLVSAVDVLKK